MSSPVRDWRMAALGGSCSALGTACLLLVACSSNPPKPGAPPAGSAQSTASIVETPVASPVPAPPKEQSPSVPASSPWDRLRHRFAMPGCEYSPAVQHWAHLYAQGANQFSASLSEAMPYLLVVLDQLEQRDLPGEFAFLPYIESTYTPLASSGDRAAGIWQLMPDTAREAGLRITSDYDGRLDISASTTAAMDLLQRYQQEFGDWRLANMAFNAGEYGIKQLVGDSKTTRSAKELSRLRVHQGTHDHLAKLLAVACVVSDPQRFHVELPDPDPDDTLALIEFPAPVDLDLAAHLAKIDEQHLRHLNPGLLHARMPAEGPFHLLVPASRRLVIEQTLGKLPQYAWREWHEVSLKQPETLSLFASANDLDLSALVAINGVAGDASLAPGTRLLLPGRAGANSELVQDLAPPALPETTPGVVSVHAGDTLWSIARHYGVRVDDLLRWNGLSRTTMLRLGLRLRLSAPDANAGGTSTTAAAPAAR
ncbi:MAG: transglycosylase SLT domain-containing protein [Rudaea sp.]|nr:transglycosylase SLT domain-containing protein [Rudaea sp.]